MGEQNSYFEATMAKNITRPAAGMSYPIFAMIVCSILGGLITGLAFQVIVWWPLPVSVAPYYEDSLFQTGFAWGAVTGALVGFVIGFITDETHFDDVKYE
jgi:tetrahydromethanopterin S-methyltransferase subunit E